MQKEKFFRSKHIFIIIALIFSFAGKAHSAELLINSVVSDHGPASGGGSVAINGLYFFEGVSVSFDGIPATDIEVYFSVWITCKAPAHEAGSVDIVVTDLAGQSVSCEKCYTYDPPPQITGISVVHGPVSGGTLVSIKGENFLDGMAVAFDGVSGKNVVLISDTEISCITPEHEAETVDVSVSNPDKQSAICEACYTYNPRPVITQMEPCPAYSDTLVTISGENFAAGVAITFDGIPGTDIHFVSSSQISCKTPFQAEGMPREAMITNPDGQIASYACPALPTPMLTSPVIPDYGPVPGGTEITISGYHFIEGVRVTFDSVQANDVRLISDEKIRCVAPENAAGPADVAVINPDNQRDNCKDCYTYKAGFTIVPVYGTTEGGTEVAIKGENFSEATTVSFGDIPAGDITLISSSEIKCKSPIYDVGVTDVTLTLPDGQADICTDCYTYLSPSDPLKIGKVCETQELDCKTASANLWIGEVIALNPIRRVWAIIISPETDPDVPITYLPTVEFEDSDNDGIYEGTFEDFTATGAAYKIGVYAEDEGKYLAVPPLETSVTRICRKGDIDRSGDIGLKDALIALKILVQINVSMPNEPTYKIVDTDEDEKLGLSEVIYILRKLAN